MAEICVLGSVNIDVVLRVAGFPRPGETVTALSMSRSAGGKGANQAVAAARAGAGVAFAGMVGDDADGRALLALLRAEGIDCAGVGVDPDLPTGAAHILVDASGENQIVVAGGANAGARAPGDRGERIRLSQLESPIDAVADFLSGRPAGIRAILNAAPFRGEALALLAKADLLVVNQTELAGYCRGEVPRSAAEAIAMGRGLRAPGQAIVVTLGASGSVTIADGIEAVDAAVKAEVRDTTGAGDCFCGYLAAGLARGAALGEAVARAHRAAACSVARAGAIPSIPRLDELR